MKVLLVIYYLAHLPGCGQDIKVQIMPSMKACNVAENAVKDFHGMYIWTKCVELPPERGD